MGVEHPHWKWEYLLHDMKARKAVDRLLSAIGNGIEQFRGTGVKPLIGVAEVIAKSEGKVVVTGIGKSGIIAHKVAATLASTGIPAVFLNAAEALHGDMGVVRMHDVLGN